MKLVTWDKENRTLWVNDMAVDVLASIVISLCAPVFLTIFAMMYFVPNP